MKRLHPTPPCFAFAGFLLLAATCHLKAISLPSEKQTSSHLKQTVVVVANKASADSLAVAHHYIQQRNLDPKHLIVLPLSLQESISREEFVATLWNPLRLELSRLGLIEGKSGQVSDPDGYFRYIPIHAAIDYLVLCKDVPLKIQPSPSHIDPNLLARIPSQLRTTIASVDSELAFIAAPSIGLPGPSENPLFQAGFRSHTDSTLCLSVTRLDGPSLQSVLNLIDRTLQAEAASFLEGRAYIDLHPHHPLGNEWLRAAAADLERFGYPVFTEPSAEHWNFSHTHDAPAIYLGWYQPKAAGPLMAEHVTIPPGAIAGHIHSTSASTVRSATQGWVGPLVNRGVSVTFGNVHEPYLETTLRPDLLISYLLEGSNLGDAALFATPYLSWQGIVIGDPLYRPFKPSRFKAELEQSFRDSSKPYHNLLILRRLMLHDPAGAIKAATEQFQDSHNTLHAFHTLETFRGMLTPQICEDMITLIAQNTHPEVVLVPHYLALASELIEKADPRGHRIHDHIRAALPHYPQSAANTYRSLLDRPRTVPE